MDKIVQTYMEGFLKQQQITEKDMSKQYEIFSSYCVIAQQYTEIFDLNDVITGAGGDCGIDSMAILANGTLVTSKVYHLYLFKRKHPQIFLEEKLVRLVQVY